MTLFQNLLLISTSITVALIFYYIILPYKRIQKYRSKGFHTYFFPILGEFKTWMDSFSSKGDSFGETKESRNKFPDHKVAITNLGNKTLILIRDPQYSKEFFLNPQNYKKTGVSTFAGPLVDGGGLVLYEGETWKRYRKIVSNSFHYESLRINTSLIQSTTKEFFDKLTPEDCKSYRMIPKIQEITGEIIGRIFFGENLAKFAIDGKPMTAYAGEMVSELMVAAIGPLSIIFEDNHFTAAAKKAFFQFNIFFVLRKEIFFLLQY